MENISLNNIYASLFGKAGLGFMSISLNYERKIGNKKLLSFSLGIAGVSDLGGSYQYARNINLSFFLVNLYNSSGSVFEFGYGITYYNYSEKTYLNSIKTHHISPGITIGFRYQPLNSGMIFRIGIDAGILIPKNDYYIDVDFLKQFIVLPYLSLGYSF